VLKLRISCLIPKADDDHMGLKATIINQSQDPVEEPRNKRDTGSFYLLAGHAKVLIPWQSLNTVALSRQPNKFLQLNYSEYYTAISWCKFVDVLKFTFQKHSEQLHTAPKKNQRINKIYT
jgi:hypothetical protein